MVSVSICVICVLKKKRPPSASISDIFAREKRPGFVLIREICVQKNVLHQRPSASISDICARKKRPAFVFIREICVQKKCPPSASIRYICIPKNKRDSPETNISSSFISQINVALRHVSTYYLASRSTDIKYYTSCHILFTSHAST